MKCNINDDDSSILSQQASGACNTSQLPPDTLAHSLTGAATQNTICEYPKKQKDKKGKEKKEKKTATQKTIANIT